MKRVIFAATMLLFALATLMPTASYAQEAKRGKGVLTKLSKKQVATFRGALKKKSRTEEETKTLPLFLVPGIQDERRICVFENGGVVCMPLMGAIRCPGEIVVELPDGQQMDVDVDCTGPDANGNCDCEVADS